MSSDHSSPPISAPTALLAAALAQLTEGVIVTDAEGRICFVNAAAERLHGVARLGVGVEEYASTYRLFTEDGDPYPSAELPLARAVLREETVQNARWRIRRPDGSEILAAGSARPVVGLAGERLGAVLTLRDDTVRADAERAEREREQLLAALRVERANLATVFAQTPSLLALVRGPEHVFELANDAYLRLIGHRDIIGKPLLEAVPELRGQGFEKLLDNVVATGEPYVGREVSTWVARGEGLPPEERFFDFVYLPRIEVDGAGGRRITGVIAHGADVTEQVRARHEIERLLGESERARAEAEVARADAEAANRAKSEFLAVMSHELRTPLNAIGGYAELMEMGLRGPVTEQQRADLARIQQSQRHLLGLINQVLNYTRVDAGAVRYDLIAVPVAEALAAAEALVLPQLRAKGLAYSLGSVTPTLEVRADREKLQQILLNLLSNAIKFTDPGGEVWLTCAEREGTVVIAVRDTGVGIAPDKLSSIFEPFVQVDQRLTRPHEGVGLGLAISRDLARGMGGDLTVESTPGVGSTFTLTLPRA